MQLVASVQVPKATSLFGNHLFSTKSGEIREAEACSC